MPRYVNFLDVCKDVTKTARKIPQAEYLPLGKYKIFDQGKNYIGGFTNDNSGIAEQFPYIIFGDHTRVLKFVNEPCFIGADGVKLLKVINNNFIPEYVYYMLEANPVENQGYSRHFKFLKEKSIPVKSITEQQAIVTELKKLNKAKEYKNYVLKQLDELVKSRFIEMFDCTSYPDVTFENVCCDLRNGATIKQNKIVSGYPITRIETISNDVFNVDRMGYAGITNLEKYKNFILNPGDLLISHINSEKYLGRAVQYKGESNVPVIHGMNLLRAVINNNFNPTFVEFYFKTEKAKDYIRSITKHAVNQASFPVSELKKMPTLNPPIELQNSFAEFVKQVDKSKFIVQKQIEDLQELLDSKMDEYFG